MLAFSLSLPTSSPALRNLPFYGSSAWDSEARKGGGREGAHHPIDAADSLKVVLHQVLESNLPVEILLPPLDAPVDANGHVPLLAHRTTEAPRLPARSKVRQRIREIVELAPRKQLRRHIPLQPQHLGHLHLNVHGTPDIAEEVVPRGVDLFRLLLRAVVKPEYDVAVGAVVGEVRASDGDGLVGVVGEDAERAGGVKA